MNDTNFKMTPIDDFLFKVVVTLTVILVLKKKILPYTLPILTENGDITELLKLSKWQQIDRFFLTK